MFCSVELESPPALQELIFENYIIDPSGLLNHFESGDLFQEQLQDELYEHVGDYDGGFDAAHVKEIIAPNVYRMMQTKKDVRLGLGLAKRSGKHATPKAVAEIRLLLNRYESSELHMFRKFRSYSSDNVARQHVDHLGKGINVLEGGKLRKWAIETSRVRSLRAKGQAEAREIDEDETGPGSDLDDDVEDDTNEAEDDLQIRDEGDIDDPAVDNDAEAEGDNEADDYDNLILGADADAEWEAQNFDSEY